MLPNRIMNAVALLALTTSLAALPALAQTGEDPPARVGRVALTQGQVSIASDIGAEMTAAQVNWPVTSGNTIGTARGARTELRIGSTSIRLDGDSSLEVLQLDDASLRLRLHYGSASVRVLNGAVVAGFELETPQARVRLAQPGRVRIDAERVADTSAVTVFDGAALVDGGGAQLTVRAGRRAELTEDDDVRTLAANRDAFDDWSIARDRYDDNAVSARYVTSEMTGYEDLDRYGNWQNDAEYGPLWTPSVAAGWVPYRDGSWTWLDPWGWTWVDNSPWGYAPFHYGRWVNVHNRWAWAPGRRAEHLVWAPALVGWVGGAGWNVAFHDRNRPLPAAGWYPLTPHDRFVPNYRAPEAHLRWLNETVRTDPRRPRDYRPQGLTVVPQERFGQPGRVNVPRAGITTVPPALALGAPAGRPPAAPAWANRPRGDGRGPTRVAERGPDRVIGGGRFDNADRDPGRIETGRPDAGRGEPGRIETGRSERDGFVRGRGPGQAQGWIGQVAPGQVAPATPVQGQPVVSPTPHLPTQPFSTVTSPTPHQGPQPQPQPQQVLGNGNDNWRRERGDRGDRGDRGERGDRREQADAWRNRQPAQLQQQAPQQAPQQALQPQQQPQPQPQPQPQQPRFERPEPRAERPREMPAAAARPGPVAAPAAAAPHPAAPPAAGGGAAREERRQHTDERGRSERDR